ncbi:trimeric LpxA-like protein [Powellomyces hirtus]|nr:trimeric LpxA-like protein [Powellomyces hirtus]
MSQSTDANVICDESILEGNITLGKGNIIHPKCTIICEGGGPIVIGNGNVFEENVRVVNKGSKPLVVGDDNVFQVGSLFEGGKMGNGCTIEVGARVQDGTVLGDNVVVGTKCSTHPNQVMESDSVLFGAEHTQRGQTKSNRLQANLHIRHLEYLREVLPRYHHVRSE